ncbi:MAG: CehA/McbA family metallohydrolase [Bacteroidales bacterium]|nr:CehA/McbA family metallohydrolase [Bacteroidales bacterium]
MRQKDYLLLLTTVFYFLFILQANAQKKWYKGNTHIHTTYSDGKLIPAEVVATYKTDGYDFIFITDENRITPTDTLSDSIFLCFNGEEAIMEQHFSCLNIIRDIAPLTFQEVIDSTHVQGGIAVLNHPLRGTHEVYAAEILEMESLNYIEIFNGKSEKDGYHDNQMLWDSILSAGKLFYGLAADDFHETKHLSKGWIMVSADTLQKDSIVNAIKKGNFYSTTGTFISKIDVSGSHITIIAKDAKTITFIGDNRTTLQTSNGDTSTYTIKGDEGYIRVEVLDMNNKKAWTQPLFWNKTYVGNPYISVKDAIIKDNWCIYPNPASDFIYINTRSTTNQTSYKLYNINGKKIKTGMITEQCSTLINLKDIQPGFYILCLSDNSSSNTYRFIIK